MFSHELTRMDTKKILIATEFTEGMEKDITKDSENSVSSGASVCVFISD